MVDMELDTIYGGDGNDTISLVLTTWVMMGETIPNLEMQRAGDDYVYGYDDQKVFLGDGDDYFEGAFRYLDAGAGDDEIINCLSEQVIGNDNLSKDRFS